MPIFWLALAMERLRSCLIFLICIPIFLGVINFGALTLDDFKFKKNTSLLFLEVNIGTTLVIPDFHAPFGHKDAICFLKELKRKYKPDIIVNLGDEVDQHALGDWGQDPDGLGAGAELEAAIIQLQGLYKLFPKMLVCESNHGKRPFRRAFKAGLPRAYMKAYREFLSAPQGWVWADDHVVDGVIYQHGEGYSGRDGAIKAALANRRSTVIGHLHSWGGVQYSATKRDIIFGGNAGCLIDETAYAFKYAKTYPHKPTLGAMVVINGTAAHFVPLK